MSLQLKFASVTMAHAQTPPTGFTRKPNTYYSAYDIPCPVNDGFIIYNRSEHACNFAIQQILEVWPSALIYQVVETGKPPVLPNIRILEIPAGTWGNMPEFKRAYDIQFGSQKLDMGVVPVWSSWAEDPEVAKYVRDTMGLHWCSATPESMEGYEKVGYKALARGNGLPTAPFVSLPSLDTEKFKHDDAYRKSYVAALVTAQATHGLNPEEASFVKGEKGGGGRGTRYVPHPSDPEAFITAVDAVISDLKGDTGTIYLEKALNLEGCTLYQLELEQDGAGNLVPGGRLVFFNDKNQKILEIGLSPLMLSQILGEKVYKDILADTQRLSGLMTYDNRGTHELLLVKSPNGEFTYFFSEFNKRPQVEHEAINGRLLYANHPKKPVKVIAECVARSYGCPPPQYGVDILENTNIHVISHVRIVVGSIENGQFSVVNGVHLEGVVNVPEGWNVLLKEGPVPIDGDPQRGRAVKAVIQEDPTLAWIQAVAELQDFADSAVLVGKGTSSSNYMEFLSVLVRTPEFKEWTLGCNQVMKLTAATAAPEDPGATRVRTAIQYAHSMVTPLLTNGFDPHTQGDRPTAEVIAAYRALQEKYNALTPPKTWMTTWLESVAAWDQTPETLPKLYDLYYNLRCEELEAHGGGLGMVFPRDTFQEAIASLSFLAQTLVNKMIAMIGTSGVVDHDAGGARSQVGAMKGIGYTHTLFGDQVINLPTRVLVRSGFVQGLSLKSETDVRHFYKATADIFAERTGLPKGGFIPVTPSNFHAGNWGPDALPALDAMLDAHFLPIPTFAWNPHFTPIQFRTWLTEVKALWESKGLQLREIRIKNAGQQDEWSAERVIELVQIARELCGPKIITGVHFHGLNKHATDIACAIFDQAHAIEYPFLVLDVAPSRTTHVDMIRVQERLRLVPSQREALITFSQEAQTVLAMFRRFQTKEFGTFDNPHSKGAGGTGASDKVLAREWGIADKDIAAAQALGIETLAMHTAVTPYSEYATRFGFLCWKMGLKTTEAVIEHIIKGGKITNLPVNIISAIQYWKSIHPRPYYLEILIQNYGRDLTAEEPQRPEYDWAKVQTDLEKKYPHRKITPTEVLTAVSFSSLDSSGTPQGIGPDFLARAAQHLDLTPLAGRPDLILANPQDWVGQPFTIEGVNIQVLSTTRDPETGINTVVYRIDGKEYTFSAPDHAYQRDFLGFVPPQATQAKGPLELGAPIAGKVVDVKVQVGTVLEPNMVLAVMEAMKMQTLVHCPKEWEGKPITKISGSKSNPTGNMLHQIYEEGERMFGID